MSLAVEKPWTGRNGRNRAEQLEASDPALSYCSGRAYFQGLDNQSMSSKEISDLMRFVDTNVNFVLDMDEMR